MSIFYTYEDLCKDLWKHNTWVAYVQGISGERRGHDGGHYGSSYGNKQDSYISERRSFAEERRRSPSRDGYRKGGMAPPRSPPRSQRPRAIRAPRRSMRGRSLRTRSSFRGALRPRGSYSSRPHTYTRVFRSIKGRR